jgi:hypothetical protein
MTMTLPIVNANKGQGSPDVTDIHTSSNLCLHLPRNVDREILQALTVSPIQTRRKAFSKTLALTTIEYYEMFKHSRYIDDVVSTGGTIHS